MNNSGMSISIKEGWNDSKSIFNNATMEKALLADKGWNNNQQLFDNQLQPGQILWNEYRVFADRLWASDVTNEAKKNHITAEGTFVLPVSPDNLVNGIRLYSSRIDLDFNAADYDLGEYPRQATYTVDIPKASLVIGKTIPVFTNIPLSDVDSSSVLDKCYMRLTSETTFEFVSGTTKSTQIAHGSNEIRPWRYLISIDKIEAY